MQFDVYGKIKRDDEKARLDNFAILSQNDPGAQGYIIAYGGRRGPAGEAQTRADFAKNYLVNSRGIDAGRLVTVDGGFREEAATELFQVPLGATPPTASPNVDASEVQTTRPPRNINANVSTVPTPTPMSANANIRAPRQVESGVGRYYREQAEIEKNKRAILDNLKKGNLVIERPNENWTVGVPEQILARIAYPSVDLTIGLRPESRGRVRDIRVAGTMCVTLKKPDEAAFEITPLSNSECLTISEAYFTQWQWSIKPLKAGQQELIFTAFAKIPVPNQDSEEHPIDVYNELITVQVNPNMLTPAPPATPASPPGVADKLVDQLIEDWPKVVAVIIIPLLGWVGWVLKKYIWGRNTDKDNNQPVD